jgi:protein ImuB
MIWIGVHLPLLSLESFAATLPCDAEPAQPHDGIPMALCDGHHIISANAVASDRGVKPGLRRVTALALVPQLVLGQADAARDAQALQAVVHAALAFTPAVTLACPQGMLMEVQASLRYFGGLKRLVQRLRAALAPLGHVLCLACAPTAQGAALLSRMPAARHGLFCPDLPALMRSLDPAPVTLLRAGHEHAQALEGMGLHCLGDLRRLPRAGLARRFGEALLDELDRALGARPDPRAWLTLPEVFESRLELFARADTTGQLLYGASVLLARLVAWSRARHVQVRCFSLHMQHERRHRHDAQTPGASTLEVALAEPSQDADHLLLLLRERLCALQLPAPTLELRLQCDDVVLRAPPNSELFPTAKSEREGLVRLIERLQARLGVAQVQRLARVEDHRPECASRAQVCGAADVPRNRAGPVAARPAASANVSRGSGRKVFLPVRPVWLLPQPEPLVERQSRPLLDGRFLQLLCGPERIETGWWDTALAERDYFIAQAGDGSLVWIYRGRLPLPEQGAPGWFLQGRFG